MLCELSFAVQWRKVQEKKCTHRNSYKEQICSEASTSSSSVPVRHSHSVKSVSHISFRMHLLSAVSFLVTRAILLFTVHQPPTNPNPSCVRCIALSSDMPLPLSPQPSPVTSFIEQAAICIVLTPLLQCIPRSIYRPSQIRQQQWRSVGAGGCPVEKIEEDERDFYQLSSSSAEASSS